MRSFRFTSTQRILTPKDYQQIVNSSIKKIHSEHFLLIVAHSLKEPDSDNGARLGLAITKKKLKKASDRNYIKRIARECFRQICPIAPAVDCVLLIKKSPLLAQQKTTVKSPIVKSVVVKELGLYSEMKTLFEKLTLFV